PTKQVKIMRKRIALSISLLAFCSVWLFAQVREFRPVSEAMLRNPAPGDWLNWRRTDNAWGYSPLEQINRQNVNQLQLAWSWAMAQCGATERPPVVYRGHVVPAESAWRRSSAGGSDGRFDLAVPATSQPAGAGACRRQWWWW